MLSRYYIDEAPPGGRPSRRRGQPRLRLRQEIGDAALASPSSQASTSPARPRSSSPCGRPSARTSPITATTRASSARRAARTSSSRTRPPTWTRSRRRWFAAPSSTRARSARRPRAFTRRRTSGTSSKSASSRRSASSRWATCATSRNFMGAVIDESSFKTQREAIEEARSTRSRDRRRRRRRRQRGLLRRADGDRDRATRTSA